MENLNLGECTAKIALILAIKHYQNLEDFLSGVELSDKVKKHICESHEEDGLYHALKSAEKMKIPLENIFELKDSGYDEIVEAEEEIRDMIKSYADNDEKVLLYIFAAGHGCFNGTQYIILNEDDPSKILYNIEERAK